MQNSTVSLFTGGSVHHSRRKTVIGSLALPLFLLLGTAPALAHGKPGSSDAHVAPIQGIVTNFGGEVLEVQTQAGTVSVSVTGATHVIREVSGSMMDLKTNQHVDVHLAKATTVDAIRIEPAQPSSTHHPHGSPSKTPHHSGPHHPPAGPSNHVSGQIVGVGANTVTMLLPHSTKPVTYTLSSSVTIVKVVNGTLSDLGIGETVRVLKGRSGSAEVVIILNA